MRPTFLAVAVFLASVLVTSHSQALTMQGQDAVVEDNTGGECVLPSHTDADTRCSLIRSTKACGEISALVDYLDLVYCRMGSSGKAGGALGSLVLVVWLLMLMGVMGSTAEVFFVPPLTLLSDTLKLSPAVAGCTLLAVGNGAPDIFTAHAAMQGQEDLPLLLSALLGAALLTLTAVLASVLLVNKEPVHGLRRVPLLRDVGMYLCIVTSTLAICADGVITVWESCGFICVYVVYILLVVAKHSHGVRRKKRQAALQALAPKTQSPHASWFVDFLGPMLPQVRAPEALDGADELNRPLLSQVAASPLVAYKPQRPPPPDEPQVLTSDDDSGATSDDVEGEADGYALLLTVRGSPRRMPLSRFTGEPPIPGLGWGEGYMANVQILVEWPVTLLRYMTTPLLDGAWGHKRRVLACIWPGPFAMLGVLSLGGPETLSSGVSASCPMPLWSLLLLLGAVASGGLVWATKHGAPHGYLRGMMMTVAFASALLWMNVVADEIVSVVESLGLMLGISSGILGVTIIAMSNSLGDWFSNVAVARNGQGAMSMAACFGAPVLNDLLGFGIALTSYCLRTQSSFKVHLSDPSYQQVKLLWCFLVPLLVATFVCFSLPAFTPNRTYALLLLTLYATFLLLAALLESHVIGMP